MPASPNSTARITPSMATSRRRRPSLLPPRMLPFLALLLAGVVAGKTGDLTVFWGRNSSEGSLREACDTGTYNTVIISFLGVVGHGRYRTDLSGHDASAVGADVKHCKRARNVTVLLSVGGDGGGYSLPTARAARDLADHLWHAYLGGARRGASRPFGDAVLDGVDLYVDRGGPANYDALARRLAGYRYDVGAGRTAVLLTATPRCMGDGCGGAGGVDAALATGLFRRIHVRFYDDTMCSFAAAADMRPFYGSWLGWAERYPEAEVYVGLPAAPDAARDGWVEAEAVVREVMPLVQEAPNYGGVMVWNRYYDRRDGYGQRIKLML